MNTIVEENKGQEQEKEQEQEQEQEGGMKLYLWKITLSHGNYSMETQGRKEHYIHKPSQAARAFLFQK